MRVRARLIPVLPWLLCGVSLVLLGVGGWLRAAGLDPASDESWSWLEEILPGLAIAGIPLVGALIAARQPDNPYGWLWCAIGLDVGVGGAARLVRLAGGPPWTVALVEGYAYVTLIPLLVLGVLLFPTGRVPGPGWRWMPPTVVALWVFMMAAGPFIPFPGDPGDRSPWALQGTVGRLLYAVGSTALGLMLGLGLVAVVALVVRYRRAVGVERQQLTWFVYAAVLAVAAFLSNAAGLTPWRPLTIVLGAAVLALFPTAVAVAVLRYRLYDIDRIVSRTVTYGFLTAAILAVYLLVVAVLPQLGLPSGSSDVVVAGATLAVAAAVGRFRRRLQTAVDRRFDRARYDAEREVAAFAARLRNQVDLDEIVAGLRDAVAGTVVPGRMSVWLRPSVRTDGR